MLTALRLRAAAQRQEPSTHTAVTLTLLPPELLVRVIAQLPTPEECVRLERVGSLLRSGACHGKSRTLPPTNCFAVAALSLG